MARSWRRRTPERPGNDVAFHAAGPPYLEAVVKAIEGAERFVHLEMYWIAADLVGGRVSELLARKASEGVEVRLLYDPVGCGGEPIDVVRRMEAAGAEVHAYNPIRPIPVVGSFRRAQRRNHSKLVVVDGSVAFVGGVNLTRHVLPEPEGEGWTDMGCRIRGPTARDLALAFLSSWAWVTKIRLDPRRYAAPVPWAGRVRARALTSRHGRRVEPFRLSPILRSIARDIRTARHRVDIWMGYFVPPGVLRRALGRALAKGVAVRLIVPESSDLKIVDMARNAMLGPLMQQGLRLAFWQESMVHAKVLIVDDRALHVGSANLDHRGAFWNAEANVRIHDLALARGARSTFEEHYARCREVTLKTWRGRPWWRKLLERLARTFARWL